MSFGFTSFAEDTFSATGTVTVPVEVTTGVGSLSLSGQSTTIATGAILTAGVASLSLSGKSVTENTGIVLREVENFIK